MRSRLGVGSIAGLPLVLVFTLSAATSLAQHSAETDSLVQRIAVGERLRVSYLSAVGPKRLSGTLSGWDLDTLRLRRSSSHTESIAWTDVNMLEQSISRKRATKTGAIVGALVGLAGGVAFGIGLASDELLGSSGGTVGYAVVGGVAGSLAGALLGTGIGALFVSEEWAPVSVEDARTSP